MHLSHVRYAVCRLYLSIYLLSICERTCFLNFWVAAFDNDAQCMLYFPPLTTLVIYLVVFPI